MNKSDKKNLIWNSIGATISALSSLVFLIIATRINGVVDAGIFTYSFATACLFYTISIYSTRSYQVTNTDNKFMDSDFLFNRLTTCLIMMFVSFIFSFIREYNLYKSSILILLSLYKCIETIEETLYGIIQKHNLLEKVGKSMTIRSLLSYLIFLIIDLITKNLIISIISIIIVNIFIILFYDLQIMKKISYNFQKYSCEKNKLLLKLGFNTFAFSFLSIYLLNASRYAIDTNLSEEMQTIYGIIVMPGMVMSLLSQFIIQPFLVRITEYIKINDIDNLKNLCNKLLVAMFGLGIFCIIVAAFIGIPVLNFIYGINLREYFLEFMIILVGALFYGSSIIISNILIACRKTFSQLIGLGIISLIALFSSYYLVNNYLILGASINYLLIMVIEFIMYIFMLKYYLRNIKKREN